MQQCEKFNSHLLTRIIQVGVNAVTNYQYSRREVIELTPVPADTIEDVFEKKKLKDIVTNRSKCYS